MNKEVFLKKLGARIRFYRKLKGFTQESLALEINLDRSYVGSIERGERNITVFTLARILKIFDISLLSFFEENFN